MEAKKSFDFVKPTTQVTSHDKMSVWEESEAYQEYLGFVIAIGESVKGKSLTKDAGQSPSPCCTRLVDLLTRLRKNLEAFPPVQMQQRYGNPAYRDWSDLLEKEGEEMVSNLLGEGERGAMVELTPYLLGSFGNSTRIDYGTGHEMAFVMFLCGLFRVGALREGDKTFVGLTVFSLYMDLVRDLQDSYMMEPAGSMGVWNLDDFQFVSFIWGAAQLAEGARLKPKSIPDPEMAEMMGKENHLFACLAYIHRVKTGPFHEHSNQLWNISGVAGWPKVFSGLVKMYRAEVLAKFPVIQHTLFGSVFTLAPSQHKNPAIPDIDQRLAVLQQPMPGVYSPRPGPGIRPSMSNMPRFVTANMPGVCSKPSVPVVPPSIPNEGPAVPSGDTSSCQS